MHATLLSTSAHVLDTQHLKRLQGFPPELVNYDNLLEAQSRTRQAESDLNTKMRDLYAAFDILMGRTIPKLPSGPAGRGESHQRRLDRRKRDKADYSELLAVKKRVEVLEREGKGTGKGKGKEVEVAPAPAAPPTGSVPPPPPTETGEKRGRARELLDDMLSRLEKVEGMRTELEDRYTDLEDLVNWRQQEELEVVRLGNGRWKMIEELRDPDGMIRGSSIAEAAAAKRRKLDHQSEHEAEVPVPAKSESATLIDPVSLTDGTAATFGAVTTEIPAAVAASVPDPSVAQLRDQVETLKQELADLKAGQAERDKKLIEDTVAQLKGECVKICREVCSIPAYPKRKPETRLTMTGLANPQDGQSAQI